MYTGFSRRKKPQHRDQTAKAAAGLSLDGIIRVTKADKTFTSA
jgi:hypothetical protein